MKILNLTQGSQEWLLARAKCFTASEAQAMMGQSKHFSRKELLAQKATGIVPEVSPALQKLFDKGHAAEAAARPFAEAFLGEELYPVVGVSGEKDEYLASLDGQTMVGDINWEHKLWNKGLAASVAQFLSCLCGSELV